MTEEMIMELAHATAMTVALLSAPPLIAVVVVGILVNVLQTVTQIRDPALAFVPKVIAVAIVLVLSAPWQLQIARQFTELCFALMGGGLL